MQPTSSKILAHSVVCAALPDYILVKLALYAHWREPAIAEAENRATDGNKWPLIKIFADHGEWLKAAKILAGGDING